MKILIIDDEKMILRSLEVLLNRKYPKYEIYTSKNEKEAISIIKSNKIDLIISDYFLVTTNGYQIIQIARKDFNFNGKVILMSGNMELDHNDLEIDAFISKPFIPSDLVEIIESILAS